jgi:predicted porin
MRIRDEASAASGAGRFAAVRRIALVPALAMAVASGEARAGGGVQVYGNDRGDAISLFGILDSGVLTQTKSCKADGVSCSGDAGSRTYMQENGLRQSVWGVKGKSGNLGLGGNTTAFFALESHIDISTGFLHGTGDALAGQPTALFRRQANLGLTGDWGTLIIGRQYGPALLAHLGTEPRYFKEQFSSLYQWAYGQLDQVAHGGQGAATNTNNDVGIFFSNALQYRNTWGPVSLGVLYSLGGQAGNFSYNDAWAVGADYKGPVIVSGSYQQMHDKNSGKAVIDHIAAGLSVPLGDFNPKFLFQEARHKGANGVETDNVDTFGGGIDWKWHPKNTATVAYYYSHDKNVSGDSTNSVVLSDDWSLTDWVTLYLQAAFVDSGANPGFATSIVSTGPQAPGSEFLFNAGVQFSF